MATAGAAVVMATSMGVNVAYAAGTDKLRIGLIGCGGRGTGAARDCLKACENVQLVAMADAFRDRIEGACKELSGLPSDKYAVTPESCFVGLDAYQKLIDSDVDLVILATPPGFRPIHIRAAVEAGKHVFSEKPVATDAPGVRSVIESAQIAKRKNLGFVAGTQRRHDLGYRQVIGRLHDGAIGEIVAGNCYWNQGGLWMKPRQPDWSDLEWELRNWLYFTWLSGDHIVEQHIHQLDVMNWAMSATPVSAYGMGGRQVRTDPAYGQIFDHFAIEFEYPGGVRISSMCRQIDGTDSRVSEYLVGTKGNSDLASMIRGPAAFRYKAPSDAQTPYEREHADLVASIRSGDPLNEAKQVAESTLTAIMGRMSAYSGKLVTWDEALNSSEVLMPQTLAFGPTLPVAPVAMPGKVR
jgi:predicted dehydrogenase